MNIDSLRTLCLSFPGATEQVTWGHALTFRVAKKMFAVTVLEISPTWLTFKASPENFAELTERPNIIPAPYLARAKWVALETKDALPFDELATLLRNSYEMVVANLPARTRNSLTKTVPPKFRQKKRTPIRQKKANAKNQRKLRSNSVPKNQG
jgi:predicted DNA-binding protein (MmcQ/YjbR family)